MDAGPIGVGFVGHDVTGSGLDRSLQKARGQAVAVWVVESSKTEYRKEREVVKFGLKGGVYASLSRNPLDL